jgi:hypothetical protein
MEAGELSGFPSPLRLRMLNSSQESPLQCPTSHCGYGRNVACDFNHTTPHVYPPRDQSQVFALRLHRPLSTRKRSTCAPADVGEELFHSPVCRSIGRKACAPSELVLAKPSRMIWLACISTGAFSQGPRALTRRYVKASRATTWNWTPFSMIRR